MSTYILYLYNVITIATYKIFDFSNKISRFIKQISNGSNQIKNKSLESKSH